MRRILVVLSLLLVVACSSKNSESDLQSGPPVPTPPAPMPLSCTVALPNNGAPVTPGVAVPLTISANGGSGSYSVNGTGFTSQTTVSKTYSNSSSANIVQSENFTVSDSAGASTSCGISVTILPAGGGGGGGGSSLACSITVTPSVIRTGSQWQMQGIATGGRAPYKFLTWDFSGASQITLSRTTTTISAVGKYFSTGLKTSTLTVQDADLNQFACYVSFTVLSPPTMTLTASPSTTVESGNTIAVSVATFGFTATPTVTFSSNDAAVTVTNSNGGALVSVSDKLAHSFVLTATAVSGTETATATLPLQFSAFVPLACTISTSGVLKTGEDIVYKVQATNGEPVQLLEFTQGANGSVSSYTTDSATVKYYSAGSKTVSLKARSTTTGKDCQNGAAMTNTLSITSGLSCTVSLYNTYVYRGVQTRVAAVVPSSAPFSPFYLTEMIVSPTTSWFYDGQYDTLTAYARFNTPGTYTVRLKVQDTYGNTATCTGLQGVY